MTLASRRDGFVVTVEGGATSSRGRLLDALDALTPGYETRAVVFDLSVKGSPRDLTPADLTWVQRYPIPTIAALAGSCSGPMLDLALACDIRIADAATVLGPPTAAGLARLPVLAPGVSVPASFDAAAALALGLVSSVVSPGEAIAEAQRKAQVIASRGPIATRLAKEAIWRGLPQPLDQALHFETDLTLLLQTTKDRAEGVAAFLEKREPQFTGK